MKMAKKFMALALAVVLSVGCAFCVSADGSRTKNIMKSFRRLRRLTGLKSSKKNTRKLRKYYRKLEKARWI